MHTTGFRRFGHELLGYLVPSFFMSSRSWGLHFHTYISLCILTELLHWHRTNRSTPLSLSLSMADPR